MNLNSYTLTSIFLPFSLPTQLTERNSNTFSNTPTETHLTQHLTIYFFSFHALWYGKCGPHVCTCSALQEWHHKEELGVGIHQSGSNRFILPKPCAVSPLIHASTPPSVPTRSPCFLCIFGEVKQSYLLSSYGCLLWLSLFADPSKFNETTNPAAAVAQIDIEKEMREGDWRKKREVKKMDKKK